MKAKSELLLYHLFWHMDQALRPTFFSLNESFEAWAYRSGCLRQVQRLEAAGMLESRRKSFREKPFVRLTAAGRAAALGGRDPSVCWSRRWDRKWRLFLFDMPADQPALRRRLHRALSTSGCGCLQGSVWLAATVPPLLAARFDDEKADCAALLMLEADSRGPDWDRRMIAAAWDFKAINRAYASVNGVLDEFAGTVRHASAERLAKWAAREQQAWLAAVRGDPLLPEELWPDGYTGRKVWQRRLEVLGRAAAVARECPRPS